MSKFFSLAGKTKIAAAVGGQTGANNNKRLPNGAWVPGTAGYTTSTVEISVSCRNLADRDLLSKSDPICVMYTRPPGSKSWVQVLRTEVVFDDLNPDFAKKAIMAYHFERVQTLRFEIYDVDSPEPKLSKQDTLGFIETSLGQIVAAGDEGLTLELNSLKAPVAPTDNKVRVESTIILTAEEISCEKDEVTLKLCGSNCGTWSGFLPPKTYFAISKFNDASRYIVVYRSKPTRGSSPHWNQIKISSRALCNGDHDRELKIEVWQRKFSGALVSLGSVILTLNKMLKTTSADRFNLMSPNGQTTKSVLKVLCCQLQPISTFVEYLKGGTQIQTCFAVDFTCSNGNPEDQVSLHYLSNISSCPNPYEQAIQAVGNILKDYDSTNLFPAYGFGARIPPKGDISHNFNLTLSKSPNCHSIVGVLEAYRACVGKIMLYGPTNFSPIINTVAQMASKSKGGGVYYILVIITDGVITDLQKTKKAIVEASGYPLSIIIIGVGEADFDSMEELDGDAVRLQYKRKKAKRDIVQFVAYRSSRSWMANTGEVTVMDLVNNTRDLDEPTAAPPPLDGHDHILPPPAEASPTQFNPNQASEDRQERRDRLAYSQLASEVLAEIPDQIVSYMKSKGIMPNTVQKDKSKEDVPAELPPEVKR